ncbi:MAG: hypothetical protein ABI972_31540 [Acidobacteriota bacterium]
MIITPNLPTSMRRLYGLVGIAAGILALAIPSLEVYERGLLAIVCVGMITSALVGYCCVRGLLGLRAGRR